MRSIGEEVANFQQRKASRALEARQLVALQVSCGMDPATVLAATGLQRTILVRRLRRLVERERLRGMRRHWSYDLNRHIALGQVLASLTERKKAAPAGTAFRVE